MKPQANIRILEKSNNKKGDLFGRLVGDIFIALGYDEPRLNIHKTGREVDVEAVHRTENRIAIGECKAEKSKSGGDAINKFVGSLDVEKKKRLGKEIVGYFVSLAGFSETVLEQEKEVGGCRVVLLDGKRVLEELIKGRILVPLEKAAEKAGRYAVHLDKTHKIDTQCELLAHQIGWVWAIFYTQGKKRCHVALIHADGEPLSLSVAKQIVSADKVCGGKMHLVDLLNNQDPEQAANQTSTILQKYHSYINVECGEILLDGLPADNEVGTRRLKLENLFVPLHLEPCIQEEEKQEQTVRPKLRSKEETPRIPVGKVLASQNRLAILAAPGGGKSTLIKRIAIAYVDEKRRASLDDDLPSRKWLPIFIRCRELGDLAKATLTEVIGAIPKRAEMGDLESAFLYFVGKELHAGNVLLLVDGLDEISDESARIAFVKQLRTFLSIYPTASIVVTSREAGFRVIGGALTSHCSHYRLARLDQTDILRLSVAWHVEVIGDRKDVRAEAEKLARSIAENDRIFRLAENPLLFTTLLLVKRWVGQLPTRRSVLYGKAIEVLLMTWNVEAHQPLDQEEIIPQLAFVAFVMMQDGIQQISRKKLNAALVLAREQMPEILGYAKLSVSEFIERVEHRSSLLMISGYELEDGSLVPMYEFRHLTFQEYLTARAIVEGYYPERKDADTALALLEPHLQEERWREVVPLVGVLLGRKAESLVLQLVEICKSLPTGSRREKEGSKNAARIYLRRLVQDEMQVSPSTARSALSELSRLRYSGDMDGTVGIARGKYGDLFREVAIDGYFNTDKDFFAFGGTIAEAFLVNISGDDQPVLTREIADKICALLEDNDKKKNIVGAFLTMELAYLESRFGRERDSKSESAHIVQLATKILPLLFEDNPHSTFAACWAYAWIGNTDKWKPMLAPNVLERLLLIWKASATEDGQRAATWALAALPLLPRTSNPLASVPRVSEFLQEQWTLKEKLSKEVTQAILTTAFYIQSPWSDKELGNLIKQYFNGGMAENRAKPLLRALAF